jgi:hypothetical protein
MWENGPHILKQVEKIGKSICMISFIDVNILGSHPGPQYAQMLESAGISTIPSLMNTEPDVIENVSVPTFVY